MKHSIGKFLSPILLKGFTRNDIAVLAGKMGCEYSAEIGVKAGKYSEHICKSCANIEHICVDPWVEYSSFDGVPRPQKHVNIFRRTCESRLRKYNVRYIVKMSADAVKEVPLDYLDFVYIDANHHYKHVKHDVENWSLRVKPGGIVAGHDYVVRGFHDVRDYISEYTQQYGVEVYITDEAIPSWFFVRR